jgi:3-dehydroquinate dehydratase II
MRILLLNGPNLGMLGTREPDIYGTTTLAEIVDAARAHAVQRGATLDHLQSNYEGALIDRLEQRDYDGIVVNPGALTHYGYSLYDGLVSCAKPVIEIHISDLDKREHWRRGLNVIRPATAGHVMGRGWQGYLDAVDLLIDVIRTSEGPS